MSTTSDLELLGAGREAEIFAWEDGRVLRLAREPSADAMIEREVTALAAAQRAGAHVPRVYERVTVDGRPGVVLERVDGIDLLGSLAGRPYLRFRFCPRGMSPGISRNAERQTHQPSTATISAIRPAPTMATQASAESAVAVRNAGVKTR